MSYEESMHEVLESSRYDFLTGRRTDIREVIYDALESFLIWLFENLGIEIPESFDGNTSLIATIILIIAIILAAFLLFFLIRTFIRKRKPKRHTIADIFEELRNHTVAELLQFSRTAPNKRLAVRYKYIAVILCLNEKNIIEIEPSATSAIITRQIEKEAPHLSVPFAVITEAFHLTWFGHKDLSDESFSAVEFYVKQVIN